MTDLIFDGGFAFRPRSLRGETGSAVDLNSDEPLPNCRDPGNGPPPDAVN